MLLLLNLPDFLLSLGQKVKIQQGPAENTVLLQGVLKLLEIDLVEMPALVRKEPLQLGFAVADVLALQNADESVDVDLILALGAVEYVLHVLQVVDLQVGVQVSTVKGITPVSRSAGAVGGTIFCCFPAPFIIQKV